MPTDAGPQPPVKLTCDSCGQKITGTYFKVDEKIYCYDCNEKIGAEKTGGLRPRLKWIAAIVIGGLILLGAYLYLNSANSGSRPQVPADTAPTSSASAQLDPVPTPSDPTPADTTSTNTTPVGDIVPTPEPQVDTSASAIANTNEGPLPSETPTPDVSPSPTIPPETADLIQEQTTPTGAVELTEPTPTYSNSP